MMDREITIYEERTELQVVAEGRRFHPISYNESGGLSGALQSAGRCLSRYTNRLDIISYIIFIDGEQVEVHLDESHKSMGTWVLRGFNDAGRKTKFTAA